MRVLVIPDIHLKPHIFELAELRISQNNPDKIVCLMDIPDGFGKAFNIELYEKTFKTAVGFAEKHNNSLWCWGNHDVSYLWNFYQSGFSSFMIPTVCKYLEQIEDICKDRIKFIHRIDNVLFMHAALTDSFVKRFITEEEADIDIDVLLERLNSIDKRFLWEDASPLWARPIYTGEKLFKEYKFLQVGGHTPVENITKVNGLLYCDTFSTYRNGKQIGPSKFVLLDTETQQYREV